MQEYAYQKFEWNKLNRYIFLDYKSFHITMDHIAIIIKHRSISYIAKV